MTIGIETADGTTPQTLDSKHNPALDPPANGDVLVGQKVTLIVNFASGGPDASSTTGSFQWHVPNAAIKNYTLSATTNLGNPLPQSGSATALSGSDLTTGTLIFYPSIIGDNQQFSVDVTTNGNKQTIPITLNFKGPTISLTGSASNGGPGLIIVGGSAGIQYGLLTNPNTGVTTTPGMTFSASGFTAPTGFENLTGSLAFFQIVEQNNLTLNGTNVNTGTFTDGSFLPYQPSSGIVSCAAVTGSATITGSDTPATLRAGAGNYTLTIANTFNMHLMFLPSGSTSIWIDLMDQSWSYGGTLSGTVSGTLENIGVSGTSSNAANPAPGTSEPVWNSVGKPH
jgi:hypothetical protein